jgi:hypothetical protein
MITDDTPPHDSARDYCLDAIGHGCFACDLDGHVHGFVPSVRDRLIERGVLQQRADTRWYLSWRGFDLDREKAADMACCDFCSARPVCWLVPCVSFTLPPGPGPGPTSVSEGDWAACAACGATIAAEDRAALLARALAAPTPPNVPPALRTDPRLRRVLAETKRALQQAFWQHYRGGAVRIPSHPYGH